jgi:hypothetical protein
MHKQEVAGQQKFPPQPLQGVRTYAGPFNFAAYYLFSALHP